MGKRKERRHAGRRVKLDLFAEPSGDLGGSSGQDEVGGEGESKIHAELPNSPNSSGVPITRRVFPLLGQQPENPLMLLGQYSDDELDEESSEGPTRAASDDSSLDHKDEGKEAVIEDSENVNGENGSAILSSEVLTTDKGSDLPSPSERPEENGIQESTASGSVDLQAQMSAMEHITASVASDAQVLGDASSGWKVVLHEESNQYYYWNTVTGETSWEVPKTLGHAAESMFEEKIAADTEFTGNATSGDQESSANLEVEVRQTGVSCSNISENRLPIEDTLHDKQGDNDADQSDTINSSAQIDTQYNRTSSPGGCLSSDKLDDALVCHLNGPVEDSTKNRDADNVQEYETEADFSSHLVKHCEHLLQQLKDMKRSEFSVQLHDRISKYVVEVEIRLADIRSLACNGLSLLPFWVHSERQLKLLDAEINEVCEQFTSGQHTDAAGHDIDGGSIHGQGANGEYSPAIDDASEEGEVAAATIHEDEDLTPQTVLHLADEVDMDVDMEVEDAEPSRSLTVGDALDAPYHAPVDTTSLPGVPTILESSVPEQTSSVPPPPDEDWIPPPPPDNEPFPPPPPDEPLEHTNALSSDMSSVQPLSYNIAYPGFTYEYYGQTVGDSSVYASADSQIAVTQQQPLYYQIPSPYSVSPMAINNVDPNTYYGLQDGALQPVSVVSGAESSGLPTIPVLGNVSFDPVPSLDVHRGLHSDSLAKTDVDAPVSLETEKASFDFPVSQSSFQTTGVSAMEGFTVSSTPVVTASVATASTAPQKVQSKVPRNKKRTVGAVSTLRSNKKVSSLVDKWKAAKEELHGDEEEEPENAYEKLEKKRQREIEEWRAQQIASGEAKDNANFQPLGGDWRERVKRKRAEKLKQVEKQLSVSITQENERPDLNVLSRGLPSGWQAYWDDSSKQVYYGNAVTSKTSWVRPTDKD